jgi:hypothetical protein
MAIELRKQQDAHLVAQESFLSHPSFKDVEPIQFEVSCDASLVGVSTKAAPVIESLPPEMIDLLARVFLSLKQRGIIQ